MIQVARTEPKPATLRSAAATAARRKATAFFKQRPSARAGLTHQFDHEVYAAPDVAAELFKMFHGKCAFCESAREDTRPPGVIHFRPAELAFDLDEVSPDHYWWRAYEWDNLVLACGDCALAKGARFPVAGRRAAPRSTGAKLAAEKPYLLDPCVDDPERHLVYSEDGRVASETERGKVTIGVLDLNRWWLVEARARAVKKAREEWDQATAVGGRRRAHALDRLLDAARPYAGARRQFVATWMREADVEAPAALAGSRPQTQARRREAEREIQQFERTHRRYSLEEDDDRYFSVSHHIERLELRNFRLFRELEIEFPRAARLGAAPWLVLLGDNGTGKSSVLQAIALALMGKEYRDSLGLDPSHFVRHGARVASVSVRVSGIPDPVELTARRGEFEGSDADPRVLLLGYGATRLLPRLGVPTPRVTSYARVDNLFNPFVPLHDPQPWLKSLTPLQFRGVARALKRLLALSPSTKVDRGGDGLRLVAPGRTLTLEDLSDGYQSVVALATDMMQVLMHRWPDAQLAEGLALVDEVEAHMHPRWRMRIVAALRDVFPRVQFVASAQDPLCLRGLRQGETVLLRRHKKQGSVAITDLPAFKGLRVDQLLTSEMFGLNSTYDPEVDALMREYRQLRWASDGESPEQRRRRKEVESRLDTLQQLGRNPRERLLYEAADEYIAKEGRIATGAERSQLKRETKDRLVKLFGKARAR